MAKYQVIFEIEVFVDIDDEDVVTAVEKARAKFLADAEIYAAVAEVGALHKWVRGDAQ